MARQKSNNAADVFLAEMRRRDGAESSMQDAWKAMTPGQEIRVYRQIKGLSQTDVAKLARVNKETVVRIEQDGNVRVDTLERVKEAVFGKSQPAETTERIFPAITDEELEVVRLFRELPVEERQDILARRRHLSDVRNLRGAESSSYTESVRARDESAHEKKSADVTSSVSKAEVKQEHPGQGGPAHAADAARDHLPEPEATIDAKVRRLIQLKGGVEIIKRLNAAAEAIQRLADDLRSHIETPSTGEAATGIHGGRPTVRRTGARRDRS